MHVLEAPKHELTHLRAGQELKVAQQQVHGLVEIILLFSGEQVRLSVRQVFAKLKGVRAMMLPSSGAQMTI